MKNSNPHRAWAWRIMERWEAGNYQHAHLARWAYDVAGVPMPPRGCAKAGRRTDRKTVAAGLVEA